MYIPSSKKCKMATWTFFFTQLPLMRKILHVFSHSAIFCNWFITLYNNNFVFDSNTEIQVMGFEYLFKRRAEQFEVKNLCSQLIQKVNNILPGSLSIGERVSYAKYESIYSFGLDQILRQYLLASRKNTKAFPEVFLLH